MGVHVHLKWHLSHHKESVSRTEQLCFSPRYATLEKWPWDVLQHWAQPLWDMWTILKTSPWWHFLCPVCPPVLLCSLGGSSEGAACSPSPLASPSPPEDLQQAQCDGWVSVPPGLSSSSDHFNGLKHLSLFLIFGVFWPFPNRFLSGSNMQGIQFHSFFFNLPSHLFFSHYFLLVSLWYFSFCYLGLSKYYILRTGEWKILGDKSINQQKCLQEFQEKCLLLSSYAKLPFKQIPEGDSWLFQQLAFFNYKCSSGN